MDCFQENCSEKSFFVCSGEDPSFLCCNHIITHMKLCSRPHITIQEYNDNREASLNRIRKQKLQIIKAADSMIFLIKELSLEALTDLDNIIINNSGLAGIEKIPDPINQTLVEFSIFFLKECFNKDLSKQFTQGLYNTKERSFELCYENFHQLLIDKVKSIQIKEKELKKRETKEKNENFSDSLLVEKVNKQKEKIKELRKQLKYLNHKIAFQVVEKVSENVYKNVFNKIFINIKEVSRIIKTFKYQNLSKFLEKHSENIENVKISDDLNLLFTCEN